MSTRRKGLQSGMVTAPDPLGPFLPGIQRRATSKIWGNAAIGKREHPQLMERVLKLHPDPPPFTGVRGSDATPLGLGYAGKGKKKGKPQVILSQIRPKDALLNWTGD